GHPLSKRGVCFRELPGTLCQPHLKFLGGSLQLVFGLFQRSHVLLQYRASLEKLRASLLNSPLDLGDVISQRFFTLLVSGDLLAESAGAPWPARPRPSHGRRPAHRWDSLPSRSNAVRSGPALCGRLLSSD